MSEVIRFIHGFEVLPQRSTNKPTLGWNLKLKFIWLQQKNQRYIVLLSTQKA